MKKFLQIIFFALLPFARTAQNFTNGGYDPLNPYGQMQQQQDTSSSKKKKKQDVKHQHYTWKWMHDGVYKKIVNEDTLFSSRVKCKYLTDMVNLMLPNVY